MTEGPDGGSPLVVDARGLRCPLPVIKAARAARDLGPGELLEVLATDPAAGPDLGAWARMRGHHVEELHQDGDDVRVVVRLG